MRLLVASLAAAAAAHITRIPEAAWRQRARLHAERTRRLLAPGLVSPESVPRRLRSPYEDGWTALSTEHPVTNFLEEYYHIRGGKGTRRLARFSPALAPGGTLLVGAAAEDFASGVLHMKGARVHEEGVLYDAALHHAGVDVANATAYIWYRDVLAHTATAEPVLHCDGLHEWAMQYWPADAQPPPSARYQRHLNLRVDRATINLAVERRGISCTHVDALRFFAPAAAPLNKHGASLRREQQAELEQPGCVHAHMDLLKMALRLAPWLACELVGDCLEIALAARTLDVAASPYDATAFGIAPVPIETSAGRKLYREQQEALMLRAAPVRERLTDAYDAFLECAFGKERLQGAEPAAERFASATPGGPPWRRSLLGETR